MAEEEQMWQSCAKWLCALDVLPVNHKVMMPDATFQDLAYTLRDGVVLCHIASTLDETSIPSRLVNYRPQMAQVLCLKNIRLFLSACKKSFGLKDPDLFEPTMLYNFEDFAKVLSSLSELSKCPKVRSARPDIEPWPTASRALPEQEEEVIYKRLESQADEETYEEFYYNHHGGSNYGYVWGDDGANPDHDHHRSLARRQYYTNEEQEEIYADLGLGRGQNYSRGGATAAARLVDWNFEPKVKRDYCLQELLQTEANYVDVLNALRKNFIRPITTIKESDKKIIFMNIKELGDVHTAFFTSLFKCVQSNGRVGDVFIEYKEKFLKYADYCAGLTRAQTTILRLCTEDKEVEREIERCEEKANSISKKKIRLHEMLVVPMQRILKYHLLLDTLAKETPESHDEKRSFVQAYEAMVDVAEYINEVKRDSEQIHNITEIQKSISSLKMPENRSLKEYGRLRKDGELKVQSHDPELGSKHRSRYLFLFDMLILMSKSIKDETYKIKELLRVEDYRVQDIPSSDSSSMSSSEVVKAASRRVMRRDSSRWTHAFLLAHIEKANAYTVFARTADDKAKWMEAFQEAFDNKNISIGNHALMMHTFERPFSCDVCYKLLKGIFFQGFRCSKCSRSVHKKCAPGLLPSCGSNLEPPALPPRPTSMQQLPIVQNGDSLDDGKDSADEMTSRSSAFMTRQGSDTSNNSLVMAPPILQGLSTESNPYSSRCIHPDYINTRLEDHKWYVGDMDRDTANSVLDPFPMGAFLVRCGRKGYALSLKSEADVKHMMIIGSDLDAFYFSENRKFNSIVEMVAWYSRNSLRESFHGLDTTLQFPVGELSLVEARYEFSPSPEDTNMLALAKGDRVTVFDKLDDKGWWKAHNGNRIGYIPKTFVVEIR